MASIEKLGKKWHKAYFFYLIMDLVDMPCQDAPFVIQKKSRPSRPPRNDQVWKGFE